MEPGSTPFTYDPDASEPIDHPRHKEVDPNRSKFKFAIGLYSELTGMSRSHYNIFREIMRMPEPRPDISRLPDTLATLKKHTKGQLPLLPLRKKSIRLHAAKLPTQTATQKAQGAKEPREDLIFFDPQHLFKGFLSSEFLKKMHVGMGEFRDSPTELCHSTCWTSSIRTTSGEFAHYPNKDAIFPSDFVHYHCQTPDCYCQRSRYLHIGRILGVGKDFVRVR